MTRMARVRCGRTSTTLLLLPPHIRVIRVVQRVIRVIFRVIFRAIRVIRVVRLIRVIRVIFQVLRVIRVIRPASFGSSRRRPPGPSYPSHRSDSARHFPRCRPKGSGRVTAGVSLSRAGWSQSIAGRRPPCPTAAAACAAAPAGRVDPAGPWGTRARCVCARGRAQARRRGGEAVRTRRPTGRRGRRCG